MPDPPLRQSNKLIYRPDLDGLRAVAVLLVVFDHVHTRVTGGYIGVDVFFVISGYLISSVILSEMASFRFSVANFYERRIRRIFPALLVMLLVSAAVTCLYCVPSETVAFARSLLATLFSASNFFFWHESPSSFIGWHRAGYFDWPTSGLNALQHTWSLAVEEQFYIFFPLFLLAVRRWCPRQMRVAIWGITALTLTLASVCVERNPTAAFFFAPLRAWELLLGTLISQHYVPTINGKGPRNLAATAGLLLILVPAMYYTTQTHFPGLAAMPPCLGAALLIAAGETGNSLVGRLLSWRPVVFIGLISYSLYLWHWPILFFLEKNYVHLDYGSPKELKLAVIVASVIVATLSWLFVETPFRRGRLRPGRRLLFQLSGSAAALTAAIAVLLFVSGGFPARFPSEAVAIQRYENYDVTRAFRLNVCFVDPRKNTFASFQKATCLSEDPSRMHYLLIGDSHAADLYPGLVTVFPELNISQATTGGCLPLVTPPPELQQCDGSMWDYIYGDYLIHHQIDAVLISGRWTETDFPALRSTVSYMQQRGIKVILFGPAIEFDVPLPRLLMVSLRARRLEMLDRHNKIELMRTDKLLAELARDRWKVRYISAFENLCTTDNKTPDVVQIHTTLGCPVYATTDVPLLADSNHYTPEGSILFARTMRARNQLP